MPLDKTGDVVSSQTIQMRTLEHSFVKDGHVLLLGSHIRIMAAVNHYLYLLSLVIFIFKMINYSAFLSANSLACDSLLRGREILQFHQLLVSFISLCVWRIYLGSEAFKTMSQRGLCLLLFHPSHLVDHYWFDLWHVFTED